MNTVASGISRLMKALELSPQGQIFIVLVEPDFDSELLPGAKVINGALLLRGTTVSDALDSSGPEGLIEVRFGTDPLPIEELRWINQQREQFRRKNTVVLRLPVEHATRFARFAPDLWRWATILDLTTKEKKQSLGHPPPAAAIMEECPYAPALDSSGLVATPCHDLEDSGLDEG